jgi:hypothetical protein
MPRQDLSLTKAKVIRTAIGADIQLLNSWKISRKSTGTPVPRLPYPTENLHCTYCGATTHDTTECPTTDVVYDTAEAPRARLPTEKKPGTRTDPLAIPRAISARLLARAHEHHELFLSHKKPTLSASSIPPSSDLPFTTNSSTNIVHTTIATVVDILQATPGVTAGAIRHNDPSVAPLLQLYYSRIFPLSYREFTNAIATAFEE